MLLLGWLLFWFLLYFLEVIGGFVFMSCEFGSFCFNEFFEWIKIDGFTHVFALLFLPTEFVFVLYFFFVYHQVPYSC